MRGKDFSKEIQIRNIGKDSAKENDKNSSKNTKKNSVKKLWKRNEDSRKKAKVLEKRERFSESGKHLGKDSGKELKSHGRDNDLNKQGVEKGKETD